MNEMTVRENKFLGEKYYYSRHISGLDIYVFPKALTTSYALFGTRYGSVDNRFRLEGESDYTVVPDGIAHFLEHKMFENEDGVDTFARFAKTGANANAYTSFNITAYLFSSTSNFYDSLDILLDFVTKPYFTPETVKKEQGIIAQEIRMGEDNPGRALLFGMLGALYEKNNVRIEVAGTVDSISHITSDVLYKCYNTFYNLGNMALCVCGEVTPEEVMARADKVLGTTPRETFKIESVQETEPAAVYKKRFTKKMQVAKPLFDIGIKDAEISDDPYVRMKKNAGVSILCDMLFGKSSEFYNTLYEEGLITPGFGCWSEHNRSYSFISVSGESDVPEEIYSRFLAYIEKLKASGLSATDFERCRRVLYADYVKDFDSTEDIANNFLSYVFDGGDILDFAGVIQDIDFAYVSELFGKLFREEYCALSAIYPLEGGDGDR